MTRIPMAEYVAYQSLLSESNATWVEAKNKNDYALFAPYLEKIIEYKRKLAAYKNPDKPAYDVLLDSYEKGANMAMLDEFFSLLRKELTPVILEVMKRPAPDMSFLTKHYPIAQQRVFSDKLMDMLQINRDNCSITETEHPFTEGFNKHDVRITTHYKESDVSSSMFSVIHEGGHAIYELNSGDEYEFTCLQGGASMGLHESQSRFYENLIGRSLPFCRILLPVMQEVFPEQMAGVTAEELYQAVNKGEPSLIRTEADELTYSMHVMIRYEMEKQMIAGTLSVQDLPAEWNRLYKE